MTTESFIPMSNNGYLERRYCPTSAAMTAAFMYREYRIRKFRLTDNTLRAKKFTLSFKIRIVGELIVHLIKHSKIFHPEHSSETLQKKVNTPAVR